MSIINPYSSQKTIGIVYDVAKQMIPSHLFPLPSDAISEWETQDTIDLIHSTWQSLGFNIVLFPLDHDFLKRWADEVYKCDVIHSLAEGFGSLARESWIASLCELSGIPCIGSNAFTHSICMSKNQVKMVCQSLKIPTVESYLIQNLNEIEHIPKNFFFTPHFIKPDGEGSGMGIDASHSISSDVHQTKKVIAELLNFYPHGVLIEKYLPGEEYTTGIIGLNKKILPIAQIEVPDGVYGATNKTKDYLCEKVTFPRLSSKMESDLKQYSEKLFNYFDMADFVRFDWKCDEQGNVYFLEANTLPGISKIYSVLPLMAKEAGIEYNAFFQLLFESAYSRKNHRSLWYGQSRLRFENLNVKINYADK